MMWEWKGLTLRLGWGRLVCSTWGKSKCMVFPVPRRQDKSYRAEKKYLRIVFELPQLDLIPTFHKVLNTIHHSFSHKAHMDIVPRHTTGFEDGYLVGDVVVDLLEIHDSTVVVILAWEESLGEVRWVAIRDWARSIGVRVMG